MAIAVRHLDVDRPQLSGARQILAGPRITSVARVCSRGDLETNPVAGREAMSNRPQLERHPPDPLRVALESTRRDAGQRVADIARHTVRIHIAHAREYIEVRRAGP